MEFFSHGYIYVSAAKVNIVGTQFVNTLYNGNVVPEQDKFIKIIPTFTNSGHGDVKKLNFPSWNRIYL